MSVKIGYKTWWFILLAITVAVAAMVFIPVWLIKPFSAQTASQIEISYLLRSWSPLLTFILAAAAIGSAVVIWKNSSRWFGKALLVFPLAVIFIFTWFARQNHFEWMFNPLENARFARIAETDFLTDDEMVLAVTINGDAAAYPVRQMAYHHIAQDVVGGTPITATY